MVGLHAGAHWKNCLRFAGTRHPASDQQVGQQQAWAVVRASFSDGLGSVFR